MSWIMCIYFLFLISYIWDVYYIIACCEVVDVLLIFLVVSISMVNCSRIECESYYKRGSMSGRKNCRVMYQGERITNVG